MTFYPIRRLLCVTRRCYETRQANMFMSLPIGSVASTINWDMPLPNRYPLHSTCPCLPGRHLFMYVLLKGFMLDCLLSNKYYLVNIISLLSNIELISTVMTHISEQQKRLRMRYVYMVLRCQIWRFGHREAC